MMDDDQQLSFFVGEKKASSSEVATKSKAEKQLQRSLKKINIMEMTPMQAMNELYLLQTLANEED